jgi:hypothetical protein
MRTFAIIAAIAGTLAVAIVASAQPPRQWFCSRNCSTTLRGCHAEQASSRSMGLTAPPCIATRRIYCTRTLVNSPEGIREHREDYERRLSCYRTLPECQAWVEEALNLNWLYHENNLTPTPFAEVGECHPY